MSRIRRAAFAAVAACVAMDTATAAAAANPVRVIYKSTTTPLPPNMPSAGAEAYSFAELGDEVTFAKGSARVLRSVTVTMSSWACQQGRWYSGDCVSAAGSKFAIPITLNLYNASSTAPSTSPVPAGSLITSRTQTFNIPYRPSANLSQCPRGGWYKSGVGCFNGKAANITFNFGGLGIHLPNTVVFGIVYDTTHYGGTPIGESAPCFTSSGGYPYDALNIALGPKVRVGSKPYPRTLFQNAYNASDYCDSTPVVGSSTSTRLPAPAGRASTRPCRSRRRSTSAGSGAGGLPVTPGAGQAGQLGLPTRTPPPYRPTYTWPSAATAMSVGLTHAARK